MSRVSMDRKIFILIFSKKVTGYEISQRTGINEATISQIRSGKRLIENLTIRKGLVLETFYDECERNGTIEYDRDYVEATKNYKQMKYERNEHLGKN
ncbi:TPA: hypothetical protein RQS77_002605 [Staphylococcus aureus]|nr:hypothetical protein [Staphylococcus aureus]HDY4575548.1 hypothetical protein [Staphylococcus aureus]HEA5167605.1 hypothetical protein [Staphylococcus aureus]